MYVAFLEVLCGSSCHQMGAVFVHEAPQRLDLLAEGIGLLFLKYIVHHGVAIASKACAKPANQQSRCLGGQPSLKRRRQSCTPNPSARMPRNQTREEISIDTACQSLLTRE